MLAFLRDFAIFASLLNCPRVAIERPFSILMNDLVQLALSKVEKPEILVNVISKRVRQLGQGFRPLIMVEPRWTFMDIALREVAEGKLTYESVGSDKEAKE